MARMNGVRVLGKAFCERKCMQVNEEQCRSSSRHLFNKSYWNVFWEGDSSKSMKKLWDAFYGAAAAMVDMQHTQRVDIAAATGLGCSAVGRREQNKLANYLSS